MSKKKKCTKCPAGGGSWGNGNTYSRLIREKENILHRECFFNAKPWIRKLMLECLKLNRKTHNLNDVKLIEQIEAAMKELGKCNFNIEIDNTAVTKVDKRTAIKPINDKCFDICRSLMRLYFVEGLAVDLLEAWKGFETTLWEVSPYYRDHFMHLFYDFVLGHVFLEKFGDDIIDNWLVFKYAKRAADEIKNEKPGASSRPAKPTAEEKLEDRKKRGPELMKRLHRSWLLAAFFHDIGYPAEKLRDFGKHVRNNFFDKIPGLEIYDLKLKKSDHIKEEVEELLTLLAIVLTEDEFSFSFLEYAEFKLNKKYPQKLLFGAIHALFSDQLEKMDHGILGALLLMLTLKVDVHELTYQNEVDMGILEKDRQELLEDVVKASTAIALHNVRTKAYPGLTIDYRTHPIAFILSLCDDLHEWERKVRYGLVSIEKRDDVIIDIESPVVYNIEDGITQINAYIDKISQGTQKDRKQHAERTVGLTTYVTRLKALKTIEKDRTIMQLKDGTDKIILMKVVVNGIDKWRGLHRWWNDLSKLFKKNLSYGPSLLVLCQTPNGKIIPIFAASYSHSLKEYQVIDGFKIERRHEG